MCVYIYMYMPNIEPTLNARALGRCGFMEPVEAMNDHPKALMDIIDAEVDAWRLHRLAPYALDFN